MTEPGPGGVEARRAERARLDLERVVLFSDAVFAIAITLLAIELRLPAHDSPWDDRALVDALLAMVPEVGAFALSFMVVALFWLGHYRTFRWATRVEPRLLSLNLLFLALIALLPFPTSVLAHEGNLTAAAVFYAAFVLVTSLLSSFLWIAADRLGIMAPEVTPQISRRVTQRALVVPAIFTISIPIAFVSPVLAELAWFGSIAAQAFLTRRFHLDRVTAADAAGPGTGADTAPTP